MSTTTNITRVSTITTTILAPTTTPNALRLQALPRYTPSPQVGDGRSTISRTHCQIRRLPGGGQLAVADKSTNGIFVNGTRVREAALEPGDELVLGTGRDVPVSDAAGPTHPLLQHHPHHPRSEPPSPTAYHTSRPPTSTATDKNSSSNRDTHGPRRGRGNWWCATPPSPPLPPLAPPPTSARAPAPARPALLTPSAPTRSHA